MLPIITEEISASTYKKVFGDVAAWRKNMVGHLKEENPEVNSAILEITKQTGLDPKAVALGAYVVYQLIEQAVEEADNEDEEDL